MPRALGNQASLAWARSSHRAGGTSSLIAPDSPSEREAKAVAASGVQRICADCEEEQHGGAPADEAVTGPAARAGRPLSEAELTFFEPRFGRDLSRVRVHTRAGATRALAHELTHVVQQTDPPAATTRRGLSQASGSREHPAAVLSDLGAGDALDTGVRSRMESAFGMRLPDVRVHRGARAASLADQFHARAFTLGHHIAFARGAWQPGTPGGDLLIAHELAHVLQQQDQHDHAAAEVSEDSGAAADPALERDAGAAAVGATLSLWGRLAGAARAVVGTAAPRLRSGLVLQRCDTKTPDGVSVGPTDKSKIFCLKTGSFVSSTSVGTNTTTSATGRQDMTFEGLNTGTQEGKPCSCDCGLYRHWIRGFWRWGGAASDKQYDFSSCGHSATLKETEYIEEYTSCIGDNDADACKWSYSDWPGWNSGLSDGTYISLSYDFIHQVWDRCQGRSVATHTKSLRISGDTAPRSITWT